MRVSGGTETWEADVQKWMGLALVCVIGCSPDGELDFSSATGATPTTTGGQSGGSGASGGAGGATGGTAGVTSTATAGGTRGTTASSSTGCQPTDDPCVGGTKCGQVDNCGVKVTCDTCSGAMSCVNETCCTMVTCADFPNDCGGAQEDNGCGEPMFCGSPVCGDGNWMACEDHKCACAVADDYSNQAWAVVQCEQMFGDTWPYYCGVANSQIPSGCKSTGKQNTSVPGHPVVWCCPND